MSGLRQLSICHCEDGEAGRGNLAVDMKPGTEVPGHPRMSRCVGTCNKGSVFRECGPMLLSPRRRGSASDFRNVVRVARVVPTLRHYPGFYYAVEV